MKLKTTYNCVIATIYNYMTQVQKLDFELEAFVFNPSYFKLVNSYDGFLTSAPVEEVVLPFLQRVQCDMMFPNVSNPAAAMTYAHEHLRTKGILPVSINLRYDVLDPLPFDNDAWHFHIIVDREDSRHFRMYDQFEDAYYVVAENHLMKAIDTPFNYRFPGQFTPFMLMESANMAEVRKRIAAGRDGLGCLREAVGNYPLHINLYMGGEFIRGIAKYAGQKPPESAMYKLMNYPHIICRSRQLAADFVKKKSLYGDAKAEGMDRLLGAWEGFRKLLGITLHRKESSEFIRLQREFEQLIYLEYRCLREVMDHDEAAVDI